ncbi:unnamed protein product [Diatraea saccharalis]|uniref:DNA oxidative demethylase ALKBH2 n=1 Tax=Diatraea saccharalis TaxID=40085 RepID=A0A9N9QU97_9NEOP|nr:unnamed protein product [Diatraea saccharalis]
MDKLKTIDLSSITWKNIKDQGLDLDYTIAIPKNIANELLKELDESLEYFTGELSQVRVFGKLYPLPRQQVAYGGPGITYSYSGTTVPALPWPTPVLALRDFLTTLKGIKYEFVLVNKYRNGNDHMGEHRDNEPELDSNYPITSVSLGQDRDFILKHKDARKSAGAKIPIPPVKLTLEHGSILLMNPPTNSIWYHSLPVRKRVLNPRINLTFRKMRTK